MQKQLELWVDRPTEATILAVYTPKDSVLSRKQIADRLGMGKTKLLIDLLESMVEKGVLKRSVTALRNGVDAYVYERA